MMRLAYPRTLSVARRASAVLCVLLVLFISFVSIVHSHAGDSNTPDHSCAVCALAHAGVVPVEIASQIPILAPAVVSEAPTEASHSLLFVSSSYIRPPPQA